jgi:membrane associated rhomboid family serine protease
MILPMREDELTVGRLPWATFGRALTFTVFFALSALVDHDWAAWAMLPSAWTPRSHLTHLLLHATWAHWLGSVVLLLAIGAALEVRWGHMAYLLFFILSGLLTAAAIALLTPESTRPLVGPSGALAAVVGALLFEFRTTGIDYTWVAWYRGPLRGSFSVPAYAAAALWFLCEVAMQLASRPDGFTRGETHAAQLTGLALGIGAAWGIARLGLGTAGQGARTGVEAAIREARMAGEGGDPLLAFIQLERTARAYPDHPALLEALWQSARDCGRADQAAPLMLLQVQQQLSQTQREPAARLWCEIDAAVPDLQVDPRLLVQLAPILAGMGRRRQAARALRSALGGERPVSPGIALRIAELARDVHAPTAVAAARRALEAPDLHEAKRARIEALVAELGSCAEDDLDLAPAAHESDRSIAIEIEDPLAPPPGLPQPIATAAARVAGEFALSTDGSLEDSGGHLELSSEPPIDPAAPAAPGSPLAAPPPPPSPADDPRDPHGAVAPQRTLPPPPHDAPLVEVGLETAAQEMRFHAHKIIEAVPVAFGAERLELSQVGGKRGHLEYRRIDAVSAAAVRGLAEKPVIVIDLILNWTELESSQLRVIRLRSDAFDAAPFAPGAARPLDAFRKVAEMLLGRSRGLALPDPASAQGRPFRIYEDLATYQRDVLLLSD